MYPFLFFDRFLRNILYYKFFLNYSIKIKLKPMLHKIMFFSKLIKKTYIGNLIFTFLVFYSK